MVQRYAFFLIYANFGAWKSQNNEIFGEEKGFRGCFVGIRSRRKGQRKAPKGTIGSRNDARKVHRWKGREERNGGAARSANLGGCKGRAANGGEGKSGRYYRPEKEERSDARDKGKREKSGRYYRPEKEERKKREHSKREHSKKRIADTIGTKNIKFYFIERKTPENLHMCKKKCIFARFLWAKDELVDEITN